MSYQKHIEADARLIILKELAQQIDGRLNSTILNRVLEAFGHRRSRDWLDTQLRALEEIGAIRITAIGTVLVAELLPTGLDHLERRRILVGVARPSFPAD